MELHEVLAKVDREQMNGQVQACLDQLVLCVEAQDWILVAHQAQWMIDVAKACADQREARDWGTLVQQVASVKWNGHELSLVALRRHVEWMLLGRDRTPWNSALACMFAGLADGRLSLSMFGAAVALFATAAARSAKRGDYDRCVEAHALLNWCDDWIADAVPTTYVDATSTPRTLPAAVQKD